MEESSPSRAGRLPGKPAIIAVVAMLASGWSAGAHSRTQNEVDCLDDAADAISEPLHINRIDHIPIPSLPAVSAAADDAGTDDDHIAPLLDLTPRAESTLREVFDTVDFADDADTAREMPASPIAEMEELPDVSELPDNVAPAAPYDPDSDLPLLQRQMFRTDI